MPSTKYDRIWKNYNRTRRADPGIAGRLLFHLNPKTNGTYLDIGCGTGNYTASLQRSGFRLIGMDPSWKMLKVAQLNNPAIDWRIGHAENTSLQSESIDGVLATLTMHHWKNLTAGFKEMQRILKPGAEMVIFTSSKEQMRGYWLNYYFPKMMDDSIRQMPSLQQIEKSMEETGLKCLLKEKYFIPDDLQDLFLYCGKNNPSLYFDADIRAGISSFSSLANKTEVTHGLRKLSDDLKSGRFYTIADSYPGKQGDYLFLKFMK